MRDRKLQVFVSSTYLDLVAERQAAVQAILLAGHIPAGMELFASGDQTQLEVIRQWIRDSDAFLLVLGGRYGSIEPISGKSYVQLEYEYALDLGKPVFAIVMSDEFQNAKVQAGAQIQDILERQHPELLKPFREAVLSKISKICNTLDQLQLATVHKLSELSDDSNLVGWIRGDGAVDAKEMLGRLTALQDENNVLSQRVKELSVSGHHGPYEYEYLVEQLSTTHVPANNTALGGVSILDCLVNYGGLFLTGLSFVGNMTTLHHTFVKVVLPTLCLYELAERLPGTSLGFILTNSGKRLLVRARREFERNSTLPPYEGH